MTIATDESLAVACAFWQAGRDGGSSLLRAAARVITGVPHYFCDNYIHEYETRARRDPVALAYACTLLNAVTTSSLFVASHWATRGGLVVQDFAGRGLASNAGNDAQIEQRLDDGVIDMPLWGVTLDREVTQNYGSRFLLEIVEPFPAVPAWLNSKIKSEEQELVTGGHYQVVQVDRSAGHTHARLRWTSPVDPVLICARHHERPASDALRP